MTEPEQRPMVLKLWQYLAPYRIGRWLFTRSVCRRAPYFGSISPLFHELAPGFCRVSMKKRRRVQNHIGTVHALAMGNLCELAAGLMMEATTPQNMRWIPKGMQIQYLAKAPTDISATARIELKPWSEAQDVIVPVSVTDIDGKEVVHADITMYVSPKK
jgi:acyl-coenzyme A thioesterase PaaI-like protein